MACDDTPFEGVSPEVSKIITELACQPQTSVSLQTLMQTGRGEFLHKTYKHLSKEEVAKADNRVATEKILIQVCTYLLLLLKL
jgi:hypothetical protein